MYFHYFVLAVFLKWCAGLEVIGEVSFDIRLLNHNERGELMWRQEKQGHEVSAERGKGRERHTEAPALECVYQYPETSQVDALLSNMMNQLTNVFTRTYSYMHGQQDDLRRAERRFKVVTRGQQEFFDSVYANMSAEYRRFYNETSQRVNRAGRDPCENQEEIKQQWRQLLDKAKGDLEQASQSCVQYLLSVQNRADDSKTKNKVEQFLAEELKKIRAKQLDLLCDDFQLCYNELL